MVGPSAEFCCSNDSKKRSKQKVEELKPISTNQTHMYEYIKSAPTEHICTNILNQHQQLADATALLTATIDGGGSTACGCVKVGTTSHTKKPNLQGVGKEGTKHSPRCSR
jgi:hypothetical protein